MLPYLNFQECNIHDLLEHDNPPCEMALDSNLLLKEEPEILKFTFYNSRISPAENIYDVLYIALMVIIAYYISKLRAKYSNRT